MYNDRPSTKRIVLTLIGLGVGLLAVLGLILAISTAIAPDIPSDTAPAVATSTPVPTPTAPATNVPPAVATPPAPVTTPTVAPSLTPTLAPKKALTGEVVAIDAGHQSKGDSSLEPIGPGASAKKPKVESGTSGVHTHNPESLVNLQVAQKLRQELLRRGADVVMVRTSQSVNIANSKRARIANDAKADLFIRLHCDGNQDRSMNGISTLVPAANTWTRPIVAESRKAGAYVHKSVVARTGAKDNGVVSRGDLSGFNWAKVPTILVEMGFMTNPNEDVELGTVAYQQKLALGLATGIEEYLKAD